VGDCWNGHGLKPIASSSPILSIMRFGVLRAGSYKLLVFKTESRSSRASYVSGYELVVHPNFPQIDSLTASRAGPPTLMFGVLASLFASASLVAVGTYSDDKFEDVSTSEREADQVYAEHLQFRHF
jgi:hypothetical protein